MSTCDILPPSTQTGVPVVSSDPRGRQGVNAGRTVKVEVKMSREEIIMLDALVERERSLSPDNPPSRAGIIREAIEELVRRRMGPRKAGEG